MHALSYDSLLHTCKVYSHKSISFDSFVNITMPRFFTMYMYVFISITSIITTTQLHFVSLDTRPVLDLLLIVLQDSPNDLCLLTNCRRVCTGLTWETRILILYRGDKYILYFHPGNSILSYSNIYIQCARQKIKHCLYSLSGETSYH